MISLKFLEYFSQGKMQWSSRWAAGQVYLKNLPYDIEEEELSLQFRVYGPIKSIRLAAWNHTGKMKGFGYVEYKREDSAETAVNKSGSISLHGRKVQVDYETGAPKASYKPKKSDANAQTKR